MTRFMKQLIIVVILLSLGAFVGMEMASIGITRVYGPINQTHTTDASISSVEYTANQPINDQANEYESRMEYEKEWRLPPTEDAPVNQLADKTAVLLQRMSQAGIKAFVRLFDSLF